MVAFRALPSRSALRGQLGNVCRIPYRAQPWAMNLHRGYSSAADSANHAGKKAGGDLPWLIGSIVFTVPAAYFLWNNGKKSRHGHEGHAEHHDNTDAYHNNSEETSKDESKNSPEGSSNNEAATTPADSDSSSESGDESGKDTPETSEDEGEKASTPKAATEDSTEHPKESTDTNAKHADDPAHSPNSKKSESTPDSAKIKKPVDPNRPQV